MRRGRRIRCSFIDLKKVIGGGEGVRAVMLDMGEPQVGGE